jgi:LAS superfamily LD-carboxypeptidase LdcB
MKDQISLQRIKELHPKVQDSFKNFIQDAENGLGITLRIMEPVFRSIKDQNLLYSQGRTNPGKIVTNAKGGSSFHNYGLAIDLCVLVLKEIDWNYDMSKLKPYTLKYGIEWGGDWKTIVDRPHFQITLGYTWEQLLEMKQDSKGYPIIP